MTLTLSFSACATKDTSKSSTTSTLEEQSVTNIEQKETSTAEPSAPDIENDDTSVAESSEQSEHPTGIHVEPLPDKTQVSAEDIEITNEYFYRRGEDKGRYFVVFKNNGNADVAIDATAIAKDSDGNLLSTEQENINVLAPHTEYVCGFYFDEVSTATDFSCTYDVDTDHYWNSHNGDLDYKTSVNGKKLIIEMTNNSDVTLEYVQPYALFFKDGKIFSHEYSGYISIVPGKTEYCELECFDGKYEDFQLYIMAASSK